MSLSLSEFLKGTKRTAKKSKIFESLEKYEIALRIEHYYSGKTSGTKRKFPGSGGNGGGRKRNSFKVWTYRKFFEWWWTADSRDGLLQEATFFEMIPRKKLNAKIYVDIEKWGLKQLSLKSLVVAFILTFVAFLQSVPAIRKVLVSERIDLSAGDFLVVARSSQSEKSSVHLILTKFAVPVEQIGRLIYKYQLYCRNGVASGKLTEWLASRGLSQDAAKYFLECMLDETILDLGVYRKSPSLRIAKSMKWKVGDRQRPDPTTLLRLYDTKMQLSSDIQGATLSFVRNLPVCPLNFPVPPARKQVEAIDVEDPNPSILRALNEILARFRTHVPELINCASIVGYQLLATGLTASIPGAHQCPFRDKKHKTRTLRLSISFHYIHLKCWSKHCRDEFRWTPLLSQDFSVLFNQQQAPHPALFDQLSLPRDGDLQVYTNPTVAPYTGLTIETSNPSPSGAGASGSVHVKYLAHLSAMCTEKTKSIIRLLKLWSSKLKVLIIGPRISFCENLQARINQELLIAHNDMDGGIEPFEIYNSGWSEDQFSNLIIQYESIHKVATMPYSIVIIDEITTVLSCVTSDTNKGKLRDNAVAFRSLLTNATQVLMLDADLNAKALSLIDHLKQPLDKRLVRVNTFRPANMVKTFRLFQDLPKIYRGRELNPSERKEGRRIESSKNFFVSQLKQQLKARKRIILITGSIPFFDGKKKPGSEEIDGGFKFWLQYRRIPYKWYRQGSGGEDDLKCVAESWSAEGNGVDTAPQLIAYTNRITVGLSYEGGDFDTMFIYGTPGSIVPRLLMQMKGRIRTLKEPFVYMYIYRRNNLNYLADYKAILERLNWRRTALVELHQSEKLKGECESDDFKATYDEWITSFQWVAAQYVFHQLELNLSMINFYLETFKQCLHHGNSWEFVYPPLLTADMLVADIADPVVGGLPHLRVDPSVNPLTPMERFLSYPISSRKTLNGVKTTDEQISKSFLYHTLCRTPRSSDSVPTLTKEQNQILWKVTCLFHDKTDKKLFLNSHLIARLPDPKLWKKLFGFGQSYQVGQELHLVSHVRYEKLHSLLCGLLGFPSFFPGEGEHVCETKTSLASEEALVRLNQELIRYQKLATMTVVKETKTSGITLSLAKLSNLLKGFSGHKLRVFCPACKAEGKTQGSFDGRKCSNKKHESLRCPQTGGKHGKKFRVPKYQLIMPEFHALLKQVIDHFIMYKKV
jgi:hypothetical protein